MKRSLAEVLVALALVVGAIIPSSMALAEGDTDEEPKSTGKQSALQVTPSGSRITLAPGDVMEGNATNCPKSDDGCAITVRNIGDAPTRFHIYASPYAVSGEANELSFSEDATNKYTQLYKWISIKNADGEWAKEAEFAVPAQGEQKVEYKIEVPEDLQGGAQYAVIWAQIINDENSGGIETVGQIGAVITGRSTEDVVETVEFSDYDFTKFTFDGPLSAKATVSNTGNVDYAVHYYYTAKTLFGKELYTNGDQFIAAYPGTTYHINLEWEDTPFLGIFQVEWKLTAPGTDKSETAVVIIMPVIVMIVVVLLLTVIVIWIIIISRKRKERKARKLV